MGLCLQGQHVGARAGPELPSLEDAFYRRFLAAALALAIRQAGAGDDQAAVWLDTTGAGWAEVLGIAPEVWRNWRAGVTTGRRPTGWAKARDQERPTAAERSRLYRERKKLLS